MKKQFLSAISLLLIVVMLIPRATAAQNGEAELTAEPKQATVGETIPFEIRLLSNTSSDDAVNTMTGSVKYDPERLQYAGFRIVDELGAASVSGDAVWAVSEEASGTVRFSFANAYGCERDGYLITILFHALQAGTHTIRLADATYSLIRLSDKSVVSHTLTDSDIGTVTVAEAPTATPTASPVQTATASPRTTATTKPTARATARPTATPRPTSTPRPTATPRPTSTPTATPTLVPTPQPTNVPTASPTVVPTATPRTGRIIQDGTGGCGSCNQSSMGILLLDIGIAFLVIQMVIVVLIIYRKRRKRP